MRQRYLTYIFLLLIPLFLRAQAPDGYYEGTEGLSGFALKTTLKDILGRHVISWHYGDLPAFFQLTDRDLYYEADSTILDIYSENPEGIDPYNYIYEDSSQLISGASEEGLGWNREHLFSQSFFYSNYPMYSDLHFIIPTDARVNQRRSNLPFGAVAVPNFTSLNGSKVGPNVTPGYTLSVFEPIDAFKGDVARMLLYAAVRYEDLLPLFQSTNSRNPFEGRREVAVRSWLLPLLQQWHNQDPVSQKETERNHTIFQIQGNRNPFIDHPEWVALIWNDTISNNQVPDPPIYLTQIASGSTFATIKWFHESDNIPIGFELYRNDTFVAACKQDQYTFSDLQPGTTYNFSVKAYDKYYHVSPASLPLQVSTLVTDTFASDLFFVKYIEGTDNNKALELMNLTGYDVDLRHYYLGIRQYNEEEDVLYWSDNQYQMEGMLPNGHSIVLMHPESNLECLPIDSADFITASTPLNFDGWLAIDLRKDSVTIDRIGNPYEYVSFATDVSLYRRDSIRQPSSNFHDGEWELFPVDYCEGLGGDLPASVTVLMQQRFSVYPNPLSGGKVYVAGTGKDKIAQVTLVNCYGQTLYSWQRPFATSNFLTMPEVAPGLYFLRLDGASVKIVIVK